MPDIGQLRDRVTILASVTERDTVGDVIESWLTVSRVWGHVKRTGGGETIAADRSVSIKTATITVRYLSWLTSKHRLSVGGEVWSIDEDGHEDLVDTTKSLKEARQIADANLTDNYPEYIIYKEDEEGELVELERIKLT